MTILTSKTVKARKPHHCYGCAREMPAGTTMQVCSGFDEGHAFRDYWCPVCDEYCKLHITCNDDEISYGDVRNGSRREWEELRQKMEGGE